MGNLTRDPESKELSGGTHVVEFGLAVDRKFKKGDDLIDDPCFVDISVWGKQGEACQKMIKKGHAVIVDGFLKFSEWEVNGEKRNKLRVTAINVQFLDLDKKAKTPPPF